MRAFSNRSDRANWRDAFGQIEIYGERAALEEFAFRFEDGEGRALDRRSNASRDSEQASSFSSYRFGGLVKIMSTDQPQPRHGKPETPAYPDPASTDPRERDLDRAHDIDPAAGRSDDPRVAAGNEGADRRATGDSAKRRNTDDDAWQNEFTEETIPAPEAREDASHDLHLDPT